MNKIDFQKLEKREDMIMTFNDLKNDYRQLFAINDDLQQELQRKDNEIKQLREDIVNHIKIASEYKEQMIIKDNIINELKEWLDIKEEKETIGTFSDVLDKIKELEESK